jgi:hypothetical protein
VIGGHFCQGAEGQEVTHLNLTGGRFTKGIAQFAAVQIVLSKVETQQYWLQISAGLTY